MALKLGFIREKIYKKQVLCEYQAIKLNSKKSLSKIIDRDFFIEHY